MEATAKKPLIRPKQATSKPQTKPDANVKIDEPSNLSWPVYMMCFPHTWDTDDPNNVWMAALSKEEIDENFHLAYSQWMALYNVLSSEASMVHILPSPKDFPDQVYIANVGIVLCHQKNPIFVASKYKSPPRKGEEGIAKTYFNLMEYPVHQCPHCWEGEADLKHVRDKIYVGGYGIRTDIKAFEWFEEQFDMKVIKCKMTDEKNYHFDCNFWPMTSDKVVAMPSLLSKAEISEIEKVAEIIEVPKSLIHSGLTNCVRTVNLLLCASSLTTLKRDSPEWEEENAKDSFLEKIAVQNGMEYCPVNMSEFEKSGAALSCNVLHINRAAYAQPIV